MEEQLIKEETAILAKEIGFILGIGWFGIDYYKFYYNGQLTDNYRGNNPVACTQSLLQKYLRKEHNCHVEVTYYGSDIKELKDIKYSVEVNYYGKNFQIPITKDADIEKWGFLTYEDALEYGLFEAMKLIKAHEILP